MVQKCNICGKIASYFDANLGEWLCEECYKKNYNKVNLNDYRNKVNSEKYDEEITYVSGRYVQDARSLLGMMSIPHSENAEVTIHTENMKVLDDIFKWIQKRKE